MGLLRSRDPGHVYVVTRFVTHLTLVVVPSSKGSRLALHSAVGMAHRLVAPLTGQHTM